MAPLDVRVHRGHLHTPDRLRPLYWQHPPELRADRLKELSRKAATYPRDGELVDNSIGAKVFHTSGNLVMRTHSNHDLYIPLFLAEVAYVCQDAESVVAFGRFQQRAAGDTQEQRAHRRQSYELWYLVVPGGWPSLQPFLRTLTRGGAVRGDIDSECSVPREPAAAGSSASVYRVQHRLYTREGSQELGRTMAAKALAAETPAQDLKVEAELEMLHKLQGHPHIIRFRGVFFCPGSQEDPEASEGQASAHPLAGKGVLLVDYCEWSFYDFVARQRLLSGIEALALGTEVLSALVHVHGKDIVHRDVKPDNVLRGADGRALLADFGVACSLKDAEAMERRSGTPGYAAPEVLTPDMPYGKKVDVFGMGVTLFFTLFGCTPFAHAESDLCSVARRTLSCKVAFPHHREVSGHLKQVVLMLLTRDPEERPSAKMAMKIIELVESAKSAPAAARGVPTSGGGRTPAGSFSSNAPALPGGERREEPAAEAERPLLPQPPVARPGPRVMGRGGLGGAACPSS